MRNVAVTMKLHDPQPSIFLFQGTQDVVTNGTLCFQCDAGTTVHFYFRSQSLQMSSTSFHTTIAVIEHTAF